MPKLTSSNKLKPGIKKEDYQKLVAVGLLTDGMFSKRSCRNTYVIEFYSNDMTLHESFQSFMKLGFEREKTSYFRKDVYKRVIVTAYELSPKSDIIKTLKELSPEYITKWNSDPQPNLNFLLKCKKELKELAVRFAMSCDGCVSVAHMKTGKIIPSIKFACAHPTMVREWRGLFKDIGISTSIDIDNANWSNIHGIRSTKEESISNFMKMGGFYPTSIKVQGGNYSGLSKNKVLTGICEWFKNKEKDIDQIIFNK